MKTLRDCDAWLRLQLQDRELHLCEDIRKKAIKRGFTKQELRAARKKTGAKTFHQFDEDGATENWFWYWEG